jgi:hypothetical protein
MMSSVGTEGAMRELEWITMDPGTRQSWEENPVSEGCG